jgi:hypothetical protein
MRVTVPYLGFYGCLTAKMGALRSAETSVSINHVKPLSEDSNLQELYYDGVKCNYHYFDSEYNLLFINFVQNVT